MAVNEFYLITYDGSKWRFKVLNLNGKKSAEISAQKKRE